MNKLLVTASVIFCIVLFACKHTPPEQPIIPPGSGGGTGGGGTGGGTGSAVVCFESEILPLFISNCAKSGCHDAITRREGYVLDSYDNLFKKDGKFERDNIIPGKPEDSELFEVLNKTGDKRMPKAPNQPLTTTQKNLIARWISEGAKNTTNCNISCNPNQFSFAANIQPILQNYCTGCHSGTSPASGINLTTYAGVQAVAANGINSRLYGTVAHLPGFSPMPKGAAAKIPDCNIEQIRKWVIGGAPNN